MKKDQMAVLSFFLLCFHHRHKGFGFGDKSIIREDYGPESQLTSLYTQLKPLDHEKSFEFTKTLIE
jgi:hypothetical protein